MVRLFSEQRVTGQCYWERKWQNNLHKTASWR